MTTIKSYTDIEQSYKLAEILPLESADMRYTPFENIHPWVWNEEVKLLEKGSVPCWSLAALLNVIPIWYDIHPTKSGVDITCDDCGKNIIAISDNFVDACYEMIIKLHELNLL